MKGKETSSSVWATVIFSLLVFIALAYAASLIINIVQIRRLDELLDTHHPASSSMTAARVKKLDAHMAAVQNGMFHHGTHNFATCGDHCDKFELFAGKHYLSGHATVCNTEDKLLVQIEMVPGYCWREIHMEVKLGCGEFGKNPAPGLFSFKKTCSTGCCSDAVYFEADLGTATIGDDICVSIHQDVKRPNGIGETAWTTCVPHDGANWAGACIATLRPCEPECTAYVTFTQGGWGSPSVSVPGQWRTNNFGTVFQPPGLVIGCPAMGHTLTLSSATAVEAFLPAGGIPKLLTQNEVNPTSGSSAGIFAGQLVSATLNTVFDHKLPGFSPCESLTQDLCFSMDIGAYDGNFNTAVACGGYAVKDVIAASNVVIGGCVSQPATGLYAFTPSILSDCLDAFNNNFVDNGNKGMLVACQL